MSLPESFFHGLFDASPNPYLVLDRDLNIASANRAYLESTKRTLDEIVGRWAWDAFPTDPQTLEQAITGYGTRHDRHTALAAGFDHYFVKPVDIATLLHLLGNPTNQV
jgi:PAS domain-containing protein